MSRLISVVLVVLGVLLGSACGGASPSTQHPDSGLTGSDGGDAGAGDAGLGDAGTTPTITQFTATPNALGVDGGTATLTWQVENADSLDLSPAVGDVTGLTQKEVAVSATTTFTLTATNASGSSTATATVTVEVPTVTVTGTVLQKVGQPAAGVRVMIPGHPVTTTDANGAFTISGVVVPYDLAFAVSPPTVYAGVTRTDPTLLLNDTRPTPPSGTLDGTVDSPGTNKAYLIYDGDGARAFTLTPTTSWNATAYFAPGVGSSSGTIWGFIAQADTSGTILDYLSYGTTPGVSVFSGGATHSVSASASTPITQTASLNGHFVLPSGFTPTSQSCSAVLRFPNGAGWMIASSIDVPVSGTGAGSFIQKIPVLDGVTADLDAFANNGDFMLFLWRRGLTPQTAANLSLTMPEPFTGMRPASGETVHPPLSLSWNGNQGVYVGSISNGFSVSFFTNGTQFTVPDLTPLGITLPSTQTSMTWKVTGHKGSVDDYLSTSPIAPPVDGETSVTWNGTDFIFSP